uniref:Uncharacterized protein n=1 Tax=Strix occidentalis caurina TaxID=311401 RepID=A0A8D0FHZ5_STROC
MPPVEAIKEGHTEKDGDSEVTPTSRDNPTVAQGKGTVVALLGRVPSPSRHCLAEALCEANVFCLLLSVPGCALCLTAPLVSDSDVPEQTKLPSAESVCHCDTCAIATHRAAVVTLLPLCRSVIVENSASSTNTTEILKPVKKRKRKDYQSPSEEEYESEQMEKQEERKNSAGDSAISNPEADAWNGSQHGASEEKKEGWSWASYLEEQKAVAAPLDLFQDSHKPTRRWNNVFFYEKRIKIRTTT